MTKIAPGYAIGYVPNEPWISDVENTNILDDDTDEVVEDTVDLTTLTYVEKRDKKQEVRAKRRKWNKKGD